MAPKRRGSQGDPAPPAGSGLPGLFARKAPAAATEHSRAEHTALVDRLADRAAGRRLLARVVDHASASPESVSNKVIRILRDAGWRTRGDVACDQAVNACGFIAADAAVRLRDAALAEADGWTRAALPDYSTLGCVHRGEVALGRAKTATEHAGRGDHADRILDVADVNALVRCCSNLVSNTQAQEEWWGGAVALDHFFGAALDDFLNSVRCSEDPRFRIAHGSRITDST